MSMDSRSLISWFTPAVPVADRFVPPDFNLGQFFYSSATAAALVDRLDHHRAPCCLCTPRLAWEWHRRGRTVTLLDYDRRFANLPGFRRFDLFHPEPPPERHDVVIFDPIFAPATQLRRAVDVVMGANPEAALYLTFPADREQELQQAFAPYHLRRLEFPLRYNNVKATSGQLFCLYGNRPFTEAEPPSPTLMRGQP
jgi:hypothetical protein